MTRLWSPSVTACSDGQGDIAGSHEVPSMDKVHAGATQVDPTVHSSNASFVEAIACSIYDAAEDHFPEITFHFVMGEVECIARPQAMSIRLASNFGTVIFVEDARGDTWVVVSPTGCLGEPAHRIFESDDPNPIILYGLNILGGFDRRLHQVVRLH
jgi:hypothetical protein